LSKKSSGINALTSGWYKWKKNNPAKTTQCGKILALTKRLFLYVKSPDLFNRNQVKALLGLNLRA
jgi:hypothetical protein